MERRQFFGKTALGGALFGSAGLTLPDVIRATENEPEEVIIERDIAGQPHKGKVLAVVVDDTPLLCAGTCRKLINEGYTGYLIRTSNNEKNGNGTTGENILNCEQENYEIAKSLGFSDVFELYYRQHRLNGTPFLDIRARLIFIFRSFKIDTVITYNPSTYFEENPDHWITGQAVEQASFMAGIPTHYPEFEESGTMPYTVNERYYMSFRPNQPCNRVVDISSTKEQKINAIVNSKSQGGGGWGSEIRKQLAKERKRIPMFGNDDETANREFVKNFVMDYYSKFDGMDQYGLEYAECFYYIDARKTDVQNKINAFIDKHAVNM